MWNFLSVCHLLYLNQSFVFLLFPIMNNQALRTILITIVATTAKSSVPMLHQTKAKCAELDGLDQPVSANRGLV